MTKARRILLLNERDLRHPAAGGAELHVFEIFSRLAARGAAVRLVSERFPGSAETEDVRGVRVERGRARLQRRVAEGEAGAHVEVAVCLARVVAGRVGEEAQHLRHRRHRVHAVGEAAAVAHQLAPAVAGHVRRVVRHDAGGEQRLGHRRVERRRRQQRLAVQRAVGQLRRVAVGELLGDLARQ